MFGDNAGASLRPEQAPPRVGCGVREEGPNQDIDQERPSVVGQLAQENGVGERQADPGDAEAVTAIEWVTPSTDRASGRRRT